VQFLLGLAADVPWTFTLDNVIMNPPLAIFSTVTAPATNADPILIDVTGLYAGQVVQVWRTVGNAKERVLGVATADAAGALHMTDHLYPFTSEVGYLIFNALGTEVIHTTATVRTPASLFPVIRDAQLPELFWSRVLIVDVTNRVRQGRVTVYRIVSEFYPVTVGDIRDASEGVLTLFCLDHADRDRVIETLSSGGPCVLRIPAPCRRVVDDMYFTPVDITEARWGDNGRCILTVDFVEVGGTAIPEYRAVTYDAQSTAADGVAMDYDGLERNFAGLTYNDMYLSPNGISP
jgi:hypothetical protein